MGWWLADAALVLVGGKASDPARLSSQWKGLFPWAPPQMASFMPEECSGHREDRSTIVHS